MQVSFQLLFGISLFNTLEGLNSFSPWFCNMLIIIVFIYCSLCSGAEYLLQIVNGAIPQVYFDSNVPAAEMAVHVLDYLYKMLDEVCLVQGGEVVTTFWQYIFLLYLVSCGFPDLHNANLKLVVMFRRKCIRCYFIYLLEVYCHISRVLIPGFLMERLMILLKR